MQRARRARRPVGTGEETQLVVGDLTVFVTRKRVKNLNLRIVRPSGEIRVSAPPYVTNAEIAEFVSSRYDWIAGHVARAQASPSNEAERALPEEVEQWRAVVKACVPPLVAAWEPILGVKAGKLAYRNMKSRWGSCQPATGRICINIRLALYPPECLEYVVVHELCHLLERGHGPRFQKLMDGVMPDWRARRDKLC